MGINLKGASRRWYFVKAHFTCLYSINGIFYLLYHNLVITHVEADDRWSAIRRCTIRLLFGFGFAIDFTRLLWRLAMKSYGQMWQLVFLSMLACGAHSLSLEGSNPILERFYAFVNPFFLDWSLWFISRKIFAIDISIFILSGDDS